MDILSPKFHRFVYFVLMHLILIVVFYSIATASPFVQYCYVHMHMLGAKNASLELLRVFFFQPQYYFSLLNDPR